MSSWAALLKRPDALARENNLDSWFQSIAERLLLGCHLLVADRPHRLVEVEFYYFGAGHLDPFPHRDPIQHHPGRWYFHRSRGAYRGGSFKGVDLAFGDAQALGGILFRGLETPEGALIDGPSLLVDYLLKQTGQGDAPALDAALGQRQGWVPGGLLVLEETPPRQQPQFRSGRVGLSLKKAGASADGPPYILRPYRYLSEPRRIVKGKLYLILALHAQGVSADTIHEITGASGQTIQRYIEDFEAGRQETDFTPYRGMDLGPRQLCRLHGLWHRKFG